MPFEPWKKHEEENGRCKHCGIEIPEHVHGLASSIHAVYSHRYVNGDPCFSPNPAGRWVLCHSEKPS
jgi:hypothetical protein